MHWLVLFLTVLNQGAKIIVNTFFRDVTAYFFDDAFGFRVVLNTEQLSMYNGYLIDLNLSHATLTGIGLAGLAGLVTFYLYLKKEKAMNKMAYTIFALSIAAVICSTIDKVFWGGSLDFIVIPRYIVDPKDIYIWMATILFLIHAMNNAFRKETIYIKNQISTKGYLRFIKNGLAKRA